MKSNLLLEPAQLSKLGEYLPLWREVPLYRNALNRQGTSPVETEDLSDFFRLPFLTKREMREDFPRNFLRPGQRLETLLDEKLIELEHTSGTSEEQVPVLFGRGWWNEQEERALRLNPLVARVLDEYPAARRANITPPACGATACFTHWLSRPERTFDNTLFVNLARIPFLLKEAELARMAEEVAAWSPQFFDLDPVHGVCFALYCERHGLRFPSLQFILASYEFVSVLHRRILERVFGVPVFNLYGSTETGHLLMENARGKMKSSIDTAFLEVIEPDDAGVGDLVVTTLTNDYMPLVRYRIGDLVQVREKPPATNYLVHGRARDALCRDDGQRVTTLDVDQCFTSVEGLAHYQLRQEKSGKCRLDFVPDGQGPGAKEFKELTARLENLLQPSQPIVTESVDVLPPTTSGKFRLTLRV
jgi:phenylacetate-CoA ligase